MSPARAVPRPTPRSTSTAAPPKSDTRELIPPRLPPPKPPPARLPSLPAPPPPPQLATAVRADDEDGPTHIMTVATLPTPQAFQEWNRILIPPPGPIATPVELALEPVVANDKEERDEAEIAAFAAALPAAKARTAARRVVMYARATCLFLGFAALTWLKWLRASVPVAARRARARLTVDWTLAKERAGL